MIRSPTPVTAPDVAIGAAMKQPRETASTHGPVTPHGVTAARWPLRCKFGNAGASAREAFQPLAARTNAGCTGGLGPVRSDRRPGPPGQASRRALRGDLRARGGQPRGPVFRWPQYSRRWRISRRRSQSQAGARDRRRGSSEHAGARCCCWSSGALTRFRPCRTLAKPGSTGQPQPFCLSLGRGREPLRRLSNLDVWEPAVVRRPRSWWCRSRRPEPGVHGSWRRHDRQPPI